MKQIKITQWKALDAIITIGLGAGMALVYDLTAALVTLAFGFYSFYDGMTRRFRV